MSGTLMDQTTYVKEKVLENICDAQEQVAQLGREAIRLKAAVAERVDDGVQTVRRAMKQGYRATEEFVDDTTHRIKRGPWRAVGLAFGAGVLLGWLIPRPRRRT